MKYTWMLTLAFHRESGQVDFVPGPGGVYEGRVPRRMTDRQRDFARLEIERAAMDLFAEYGYGNVTVEQVARAAGIGRRTFFHHFESKDELLQAFDRRLNRRALAAYRERPGHEPAAFALTRALLAPALMSPEEQRVAYQRIRVLQESGDEKVVSSDPEVEQAFVQETRDRLGDGGDELRAAVIVWTVFAAARAAGRAWIAQGGRGSLHQLLASAFDQLLRGLGAEPE